MKITCIPTGYLGTNTYLILGKYQGKDYSLLIDPAGIIDKLKSENERRQDIITEIINFNNLK